MKNSLTPTLSLRESRGYKASRGIVRLLRKNEKQILNKWYVSQFDPTILSRFRVAGVGKLTREIAVAEFIEPLLKLLLAYLQTGQSRFRDVYLNERLRYAPHREDPGVRRAFFSEVIPSDEAALLQLLQQPDRDDLRHFLTDLHAELLSDADADKINLLAVGDCLMTELRAFLPARCLANDIALEMRELYFSARANKGLHTEDIRDFLQTNKMDMIALSFLTYEGLPAYSAILQEAGSLTEDQLNDRVAGLTRTMFDFMTDLRAITDAPFLLHNASGLPLRRWRKYLRFLPPVSRHNQSILNLLNAAIRDLADHVTNVIIIDEQAVAAERGYHNCARAVIPHGIAKGARFHTAYFGDYLAETYSDVVRSFRDLQKAKVLLLDLDGTLWDGVMAEGNVRQYNERQKLLRRLKDGGILLVAVSKNEPSNIRWNEMTLQPSDFALMKINWNPKVQSIQETADMLDLALDSFVFIDDNPAEYDLVRTQLPAVRVFDAKDSYTWRSLERLLAFPNTRETEEARARTELYRTQAARREAIAHTVDYPAMMASLAMRVSFGRASKRELGRVGELIQRTNQFNTTTIRYSKAELQALLHSSQHAIYFADVSDKFGNLGIVNTVIVERQSGRVVFDSFVMSCRAMGFGLEQLMLRLVIDAEKGASEYVGRYTPTDRNLPASTLYARAGFKQRSDTQWVLESGGLLPEIPSWFRIEPIERVA